MPRPFSEEQRRRAIRMKEMLGYQVNEMEAALKMPLSFKLKAFDPTTLIEIAVNSVSVVVDVLFQCMCWHVVKHGLDWISKTWTGLLNMD